MLIIGPRELIKLGHNARLMPARYVRAYVKTNKHDAADAEACRQATLQRGDSRACSQNCQGRLGDHGQW